MTDDELKKINSRIDDKLARRRQQSQQQQQQQTTKPAPVASPFTPPPPTTVSNLSENLINTSVPSFNNEQYSIFRDIPVSRPSTTTVCLLLFFKERKLSVFY
jgi:hypothetical protein